MSPPYSFVPLSEAPSTQDEARSRYVDSPVLVVAARQTRGRGRSGAVWETSPRALAASLAWTPPWAPEDWPLIPLLAGLALVRQCSVMLKWPNDVVVADAKVGGILVEASEGVVVVGLGVNLWWPAPPDGTSALFDEDPGPDYGPDLARSWCETLLDLVSGDPARWPREEYRAACATLGRDIDWDPDGAGRAVDVDADGGLVVEQGARRRVLRSGAVRHIRSAGT